MDVAVLGAGSRGTALSILLGRNGLEVTLFARNHEEVSVMRHARENLKYLPGFVLPKEVSIADIDSLEGAPMTVIAVPSTAVRPVLSQLKGDHPLIVLATKGLETSTGKLMTEVVQEFFPNSKVAVLSGPNLAIEIARGVPTAAVAACTDPVGADRVRSAFRCPTDRVFASDDISGVKYQRIKLIHGPDGSNAGDVATNNPLPVTIPTGGGLEAIEATAPPQPEGSSPAPTTP
jgi:glycerol-3-phosphate dehydrogenase (NAD(P)+)